MQRERIISVLLATLALGSSGCVGDETCTPPGANEAALSRSQANSARSEVGEMLEYGQSTCPATLLNSRVAITAAHCIVPGRQLTFRLGTRTVNVTSAIRHPKFREYTAGNSLDEVGGYDVGLLKLEADVDGTAAELAASAPAANQTVTMVAFSHGARVSGTTRVTQVADTAFSSDDRSRSMACSGDSGGAVFINVGGRNKLLGIISGTTGWDCNTDTVFARIDVSLAWLKEQTAGSLTLDSGATTTEPDTSTAGKATDDTAATTSNDPADDAPDPPENPCK